MAMANASCASGESAPRDMPALSKRDNTAVTDSTSLTGIGRGPGFRASRSRIVAAGLLFTSCENNL